MSTIWAGLATGSVYALVAVAYNVVLLSTGVFNFAQAQFLMVGTLVAYSLARLHVPLPLMIMIALVLGAVIGVMEEQMAIRPLGALGVHGELITTLGAAVLLQGVAILIWGTQPLEVPFVLSDSSLTLLGGRLLPVELTLIAIACAVALAGEVHSRHTAIGLASLATSEDRTAAMVRGINVRAMSLGSFAIAGALCMALGPVVGPKTFASFDLGDALALKGFVAVAIGGFGSHVGALIGGLTVGLVEATVGRYFGVSYQSLAVFLLLLVVLLIRPPGLFGEAERRAV
jgi:branched-chain amino acid transport system permease protein